MKLHILFRDLFYLDVAKKKWKYLIDLHSLHNYSYINTYREKLFISYI